MKNILTVILLLYLCSSISAIAEKKIISVSIPPQKKLIKLITNDDFIIHTLLQKNTDPKTFSPTKKLIKKIAKSEAFISITTLDYEFKYLKAIKNINKKILIINGAKYISPIIKKNIKFNQPKTFTDEFNTFGSKTNKEFKNIFKKEESKKIKIQSINPYYWLSPIQLMKHIDVITETLCYLNPTKKTIYEKKSLHFNKNFT